MHDASSGERTGTYAPAHVYLQRTRELGPVTLIARWSTGRARIPVSFDDDGWGEARLPVSEPRANHFELAFEENGQNLPYSIVARRRVPIATTNDLVPDHDVYPPPPPPAWVGGTVDEAVWDMRDVETLMPRSPPTLVMLYRVALNGSDFHGYRVLSSRKLGAANAQVLVDILNDAESYTTSAAGCYDPQHAVRIVTSGRTFDYVICLHCRYLHFTDRNDERPLSLAGDVRLRRVVDTIFPIQ